MALSVVQNPKPAPAAGLDGKEIAKIEIDRELCIGAESCVVVAPEAFAMDDENKAVLTETALSSDQQTILEAAQACPVAAILLYDADGNQLYP